MARNDIISFIKELYPEAEQYQVIWAANALHLIKEDKDMPNEGTTTIKGKFVWGEAKQPKDYYAEVWKFMKETDEMDAEDFCECFGSGREVFDIFSNFEEAKKTLEEYKEKKQIRPGDFVKAVYPYNSYTNYDILVIDTIVNVADNNRQSYKCIARKRGVDSSLISKNTYISLNLLDAQVEKTGKRCKNFNYAMYTLFEDC